MTLCQTKSLPEVKDGRDTNGEKRHRDERGKQRHVEGLRDKVKHLAEEREGHLKGRSDNFEVRTEEMMAVR